MILSIYQSLNCEKTKLLIKQKRPILATFFKYRPSRGCSVVVSGEVVQVAADIDLRPLAHVRGLFPEIGGRHPEKIAYVGREQLNPGRGSA